MGDSLFSLLSAHWEPHLPVQSPSVKAANVTASGSLCFPKPVFQGESFSQPKGKGSKTDGYAKCKEEEEEAEGALVSQRAVLSLASCETLKSSGEAQAINKVRRHSLWVHLLCSL